VPSRRTQAIFLVFFAPFVAEFVSGSTAPQAWILPPVPLVFAAVYGLSALAIRDWSIRVRGGAATILLLGLAFGIVNEGMAAHSLFNPNWPGLDALGHYGRWAGVNWLWAEWIVPFHAVWSISFPIFLTGQIWPETRTTRFVTDRTLLVIVPCSVLTAIGVGFVYSGYAIGPLAFVAMFAVIALLAYLATRWGPRWSAVRWNPGWVPPPAWAATVGFLFIVAGQVGAWQTPALGPYPEVGFALIALAFLGVAAFATTFDRTPAGERARFAFVIGGLAFYVAFSPVSEFVLGRFLLFPIDVAFLALVIRLYVRRTRVVPLPQVPEGALAAGAGPLTGP
jgi:hypothetical protein